MYRPTHKKKQPTLGLIYKDNQAGHFVTRFSEIFCFFPVILFFSPVFLNQAKVAFYSANCTIAPSKPGPV